MVALTNSAEFTSCITMLVYRETGLTEALSVGNRSTYSSSMATSWLRLLCFVTVWHRASYLTMSSAGCDVSHLRPACFRTKQRLVSDAL